jgi:hypothetical protein
MLSANTFGLNWILIAHDCCGECQDDARPSQRIIGSLVLGSVAIIAVVAGDGTAWKLLVCVVNLEPEKDK